MLEYIEYIETQDGICVCRCYGEGSFLELPDMVDGAPVTSLADHVFAAEPSHKLRNVPKKRAALWQEDSLQGRGLPTGGFAGREGCKPMAAENLEVIVLPGTLRQIGDYAFYGCRNLKSVTMSALLEKLGGGAFVAANHVRELVFVAEEGLTFGQNQGRPDSMGSSAETTDAGYTKASDIVFQDRVLPPVPALRHALSEIAYEVETRITDGDGRDILRLHFPEFYEDAVENTPARIFEMKFEGTGYKYRQCFKGEVPDLARYDSLFYEASVQEFTPTVMMILCDRLLYPYQLGPEAKEAYLSYLHENIDRFAKWCFGGGLDGGAGAGAGITAIPAENMQGIGGTATLSGDSRGSYGVGRSGPETMELMQCLCRETYPDGQPFFDRDSLHACLAMARERGHADVAGYLEDYRRKHFARPSARERYMLG